MARKLKGTAIQAGTITVTQLDSATSTVIQTGGGPKITNVQIANNSWTVLDDTAVDTAGGYLVITGTGFVTGALVYFNQTAASAVTFMSSTTLRVTVPALTAGTYVLYVINPDGGSAIRVPGVTASASPAWQTGSSLADQYDGVVITLSLVATDAASYAVTSGSLPPGLSLAANTGVISGTVTGVSNDTTYTFTVTATDAQLQDSPRTFTVTITVSDPYFRLTTLLLGGEQGNTVVRDSSVNNFNLTVTGDARASNFTPYGTAWSVYFDGTGDTLSITSSTPNQFGSDDFTIETWYYSSGSIATAAQHIFFRRTTVAPLGLIIEIDGSKLNLRAGDSNTGGWEVNIASATTLVANTWYHLAVSRSGSSWRLFVNGMQEATATASFTIAEETGNIAIATNITGYLSNWRALKGVALYTANFTPATTTLTAVANTSILTCHVNSFRDASTNNFTITRNGDAAVRSFNPFNITNTGDSGSMYFDGTGDYVTVANNVALQLSNSVAWTVEFWFYANAMSAEQLLLNSYLITGTPNYNGIGISLGSNSQAATTMTFWDGTTWTNIATGLTPARWYHVAVSYEGSGTTRRFFLDGVLQGSAGTCPASITNTANPTAFGALSNGVVPFNGYISNARIVKGSAVYTANFTPSTTALTAIANTQLLTLQYRQPHNNHGFQDSSANQFLIARNGNASQGTFSPFSQTGWGAYFDGTGDYLTIPSNAAFAFGTSDFTVEGWFYLNVNKNYNLLIETITSGSSTTGISIGINSSGFVYLYINSFVITSSTAATPFNWYHFALVRNGGTIILYLNGLSVGSTSTSYNFTDTSCRIGISADLIHSLNGYLSNLRIVKGTALYTANFTPATTTLTSIANTSLLTCHANRFLDSSTNNFAITRNGDTRVTAWSPFAPTAVYTPAVHGGSAYFDGTGDYLSVISDSSLAIGTGDFTIEMWIYPTTLSATVHNFFDFRPASTNGAYPAIYISNTTLNYYTNSAIRITNNTVPQVNAWNHIALTRSGTTTKLYLNGIKVGNDYTSDSTNYLCPANRPGIATGGIDTTNPFPGYISGIRIIKGEALYTGSTYTVPTAPVAAVTNTQLLLNFTDAAILDRTGRNAIETVADARTSSVQVKFGNGAIWFDGTGDGLNIRSSDTLTFGTGDWTVEFWVYHTSVSGQQTYIGDTPGDTAGPYIYKDTNHKVGLYYSAQILTGITTIVVNTWYYIAVSRGAGTVRLFVNGTQDASASNTTNLTVAIQWIGADNNTNYFSGYLDDLRITKFARYTANFTPPTVAHRLK
jgi:hypothetical protein